MDLGHSPVPAFRNGDDAVRVAHTALRVRLIDGGWATDAATRHQQFFSDEAHAFLPPPECSHNAFLLFVDAKSTLYDDPPTTSAKGVKMGEGPDAVDPIAVVVTPELWPLAQENLRKVNGCNESYMRVDVTYDGAPETFVGEDGPGTQHKGRIAYRVVSPDCIGDVVSLPSRPDQPVALTEIRPRTRSDGKGGTITEYTLETWDVRDPTNPVFKIELDVPDPLVKTKTVRTDVTHLYYLDDKGQPAKGYPYHDKSGAPVFPYGAYHSKVGNVLWNAWAGMEVVEGTLNASSLWTMWMMGVRDGAHPQRWMRDLEVDGMTLTGGTKQSGYVQMIPTAILKLKSKGDKGGDVGQFEPAMDPKGMGEAIADYEAGLGRFAGIDAPDVQRTAGASGYALVVSDSGKRKAQGRLETPCRMGDQVLLSRAAKLANKYLGSALPEEPADWSIQYSKSRRSIEEIKAAHEEAKAMQELGVWDEVDTMMHLSPGMGRPEALAKVIDVTKTRALLAAARAAVTASIAAPAEGAPAADAATADGEPTPTDAPTPPVAPAEPPDPFTRIQIEKLDELLLNISMGARSPDVTRRIIVKAFPMISPEEIDQMISAAQGFTPPAPIEATA